jgi:elongation factor G
LGNYGHCKLRIEPNGPGKGYEFVSSIPDGVVPNQYIKSIDRGVRSSLELGILAGCPLVDLKVTVFDGSYHETDSNELAFELAGSIALREAAKKASPVLLEPVMAIEVEVPKELRGTIIDEISSRRGRVESMEDVNGWHVIKALVPLSDLLASTFQGLSEFPIEFAGYEAVPDGGWRGGTEPGVPAILPKAPKRGLSSAAASLDSETE